VSSSLTLCTKLCIVSLMVKYRFDLANTKVRFFHDVPRIYVPAEDVVCPHCGESGNILGMNRWHFDKCKNKRAVSVAGETTSPTKRNMQGSIP
jgi:hypothetical protein